MAEAKEACERTAQALCALAWKIRKYPPTAIGGVMIHARALAAYAEGERHAGGYAG